MFDFKPIIANIRPAIEYKIRRLKPPDKVPYEPKYEYMKRFQGIYIYAVDYNDKEYRLCPMDFWYSISPTSKMPINEIIRRIEVFHKDPDCTDHHNWRLWQSISRIKNKYKTVEVIKI